MGYKIIGVVYVLLYSLCLSEAFVGNQVGRRLLKVTSFTFVHMMYN